MTDVSKLKRRTLGAPPSAAEASRNLETPEVTPATLVSLGGYERLDGRSLQRSNRVIQFATRVTPEFDQRIGISPGRRIFLIVEVLEMALDGYQSQRAR